MPQTPFRAVHKTPAKELMKLSIALQQTCVVGLLLNTVNQLASLQPVHFMTMQGKKDRQENPCLA